LHPPDWGLAVKTYLMDILLTIARHYSSKGIELTAPSRSIDDYERLRKVVTFLSEHYHEHIRLPEVAKLACLSPTAFCRLFKRVTGNTLSDFVLRLRTDRAMDLLCENNQSITEIALSVGFGSHSHFDRVFSRFTGISPLRFRRQGGPKFGWGTTAGGQSGEKTG
jgi:AraC-like DNA-binding protein